MSADHEAFLRAILAEPAEDAPRLVYADWLDEHGEGDRAEFIRVQCELAIAVSEGPVYEPSAGRLLARERELLTPHVNRWVWRPPQARMMSSLNACPAVTVQILSPVQIECVQTFRRGFVSAVTCSVADWLLHGPAVVAAHPVERVTLSGTLPTQSSREALGRWQWMPLQPVPIARYGDGPSVMAALRADSTMFEWVNRANAGPNSRRASHDTEQAALDAMSYALIGWAKEEAARYLPLTG